MDYPIGNDLASSHGPVPENMAESTPQTLVDSPAPDSVMWRQEVSARLERFRMRRKPRAPKYPSLRLPFDAAEHWTSASTQTVASEPRHERDRLPFELENRVSPEASARSDAEVEAEPEVLAKVIEFPRTAAIPVFHGSELADPVLERPRIVEAPEIVPPPPALGGILIEPAPDRNKDKHIEPEFALPQASIARRVAAGLVDGVVILTALSVFGAIFLRLNPDRTSVSFLITGGAATTALLWALYNYLLTVYAGTTPGLLVARLRIVRFDGACASRRLRRWRVLAAYLSALALGLGYLWCVLDEDSLCWHDRITRTHVTTSS